jgi:microcystin degradation protein MlrC
MTRILVAGYQHETNTFAPSLATWAAFQRGDAFPAYGRGATILETFRGVNAPLGGFIDAARAQGWQLVPSCWAGATPSSYVTTDAFERICDAILTDTEAALAQGLDGIYLDLHGAAVAQRAEDSEGELLARLRQRVGPRMPIVTSLDLHANVTPRMLALADAMVAYRTYPHVDMAATGERAAALLAERLASGQRPATHARALPFLIPLNAQSTWMAPAQGLYALLEELSARHGCCLSFCMGFPAADFEGCVPMVWGHGGEVERAVEALYEAVAEPTQWTLQVLSAADAVARALQVCRTASRPVVLADTQDNPGAGGDSNTTGMLHALLAQGAGQQHPGQVVLGMLYDEAAAARAHAVGLGGSFEGCIGTAVPTFTGQLSDPPVQGRFTVRALSDGVCTLKGPMMTGLRRRARRRGQRQIPAAGPRDAAHAGRAARRPAHHRGEELQPLPG